VRSPLPVQVDLKLRIPQRRTYAFTQQTSFPEEQGTTLTIIDMYALAGNEQALETVEKNGAMCMELVRSA
jgi:hypothetical protein